MLPETSTLHFCYTPDLRLVLRLLRQYWNHYVVVDAAV